MTTPEGSDEIMNGAYPWIMSAISAAVLFHGLGLFGLIIGLPFGYGLGIWISGVAREEAEKRS